MDHDGDLLCESLLELALSRILTVLFDETFDGLAVEHGEDLDVALIVLVGCVRFFGLF